MAINQKIVDRIKKLFALGSDNTNEHEAERAMKKAHELMREHGIAMADVQVGDKPQMNVDGWHSEWKTQVDSFARILASATATLFNCQQWMTRSGRHFGYRVQMCFAGEETDLRLCVEVWPYMVKIAKDLAKSYAGPGWNPTHRTFCEAFALRVLGRAEQMAAQDRAATLTKDDQCWALVVQTKDDAIDKWFEESGIRLKSRQTSLKGQVDAMAAAAGDRAGKNVNLNFRN